METIARHAWVSGQVQGVAFRHYTKVRARELGLGGWVRNLSDGRVEVWVEGPAHAVEELVRWLERGPPAARVEHVATEAVAPEGAHGFQVVRG